MCKSIYEMFRFKDLKKGHTGCEISYNSIFNTYCSIIIIMIIVVMIMIIVILIIVIIIIVILMILPEMG